MKKVKYVGDGFALLPTLSVEVSPGDVIDVPDDFENANFEAVKTPSVVKQDVTTKGETQ